MNLRRATYTLLAAFGLLAAAAPSYAGWGSFSGYALASKNQSVVCTFGSSYIGVVRATRKSLTIDQFGSILFDDAVFQNLFATANVIFAGYDSKVPVGSFLPLLVIQNGVPTNRTIDFATATNENFFDTFNLQAGCQIGN